MLNIVSSNAPIYDSPSLGFQWPIVFASLGALGLIVFIIKSMRAADGPDGTKNSKTYRIGMTLSLLVVIFGFYSNALPAFSASQKIESSSVEETAKIGAFIQTKYDLTILSDNVFEYVDATNDGYYLFGKSLWPENPKAGYFGMQGVTFAKDAEDKVHPVQIVVSTDRTDLTLISIEDKESTSESKEIPAVKR